MVLFAHHNLIKDPPFSHLDLVSCRNLLIYLNRSAQQRVMELLHFALNPAATCSSDRRSRSTAPRPVRQRRQGGAPLPEPPGRRRGWRCRCRDRLGMPRVRYGQLATRCPRARSANGCPYADLHQRLLEQYAAAVADRQRGARHPPPLRARRPLPAVRRRRAVAQPAEGGPSRAAHRAAIGALSSPRRSARRVDVARPQLRRRRHACAVDISVRPVLREEDAARGFFLVLFRETHRGASAPSAEPPIDAGSNRAVQLEQELVRAEDAAARDHRAARHPGRGAESVEPGAPGDERGAPLVGGGAGDQQGGAAVGQRGAAPPSTRS